MPNRIRREAHRYRVLLAASMRAQGQYRANLVIELIGAIAYQGAGFAFIWVVVDRFGDVGGWGLPELALLYGLRLGAHGVFTFLFAQLMGPISDVVREGEFDRYLTRPVDPLVQLITRRFNLTVLGDLAFIAYFPATVLLGRTDELVLPAWVALLAPLAGVVLFACAYGFWRSQIRHYASTGH